MITWSDVVDIVSSQYYVTRVNDVSMKVNLSFDGGRSHFVTTELWQGTENLILMTSPVVRKDRPGASAEWLIDWIRERTFPLAVSDFGGEWFGLHAFLPLDAAHHAPLNWIIGMVGQCADEAEELLHEGLDVFTWDEPEPEPILASDGGPRFCGSCGTPRPSGARFCGGCGSPF
jgi:hypothetical protein